MTERFSRRLPKARYALKISAGTCAATATAAFIAALTIGIVVARADTQTATAGSPFAGMSQQQKWCMVAGSGPLSATRRQYARKQCFGTTARFDKVKSWEGRAAIEEVYTCSDHGGSEKRSAAFTLKRTPAVTTKQSGILPPTPSKDKAVVAMWKQLAGGTIFARNPNTGVADDWDQMSWYIASGKITNTWHETLTDMVPVDNVPHYAKRKITMHGRGVTPIQKDGRLVLNLKDGTWALHLDAADSARYTLTTVTSDPDGPTTENEENTFQGVDLGTDGNTSDWGPDYVKLPTAGLSISGHGKHKLDHCTTDKVSWQLTPVVDCGSYQGLTVQLGMPDIKEEASGPLDKWVFDTPQHPKGVGPYTLTANLAYYNPSSQEDVDASNELEWILPDIQNVSRKVDPADAHGGSVSVEYNGMPAKNSQFAGHQVVATAPDLANCTQPAKRPVKMFFSRDGHGNPKGKQEPNWFYYWMQTKAEGGHPANQIRYVKSGEESMCKPTEFGFFIPLYDMSDYVTVCDLVAHAEDTDIDLFGEIAYGIDQFGLTVTHEFIHKRLYDQGLKSFDATWYHKLGSSYFDTKAYKAAVHRIDPDSDGLTNAEEKKYGLSPVLQDTHCTGENDNEYLAYLLSNKAWRLGSSSKEDWACPGMQCGQSASPGGGGWPGCPKHYQPPGSTIIFPHPHPPHAKTPPSGNTPRHHASGRQASPTISLHTLARIQRGLQRPDAFARLRAVRELANAGGGPDLAAAVQEIIAAFKSELALPVDSRVIPNGYLPRSAWRRVHFARLLAGLPQKARTATFRAFQAANKPLKSWLAIALGDAGDHRVTGVLITLLRTNPDWPIRWAAAEALGAIGSPEAISALKQAMQHDPAHVRSGSDGTRESTFYPVREQAAGALIRLGFNVRLTAPNTYRVTTTATGRVSGAADTGGDQATD